ncbi:MAG: heavy-metal-associated domain-containing protein [Bacteroidales bacterium]|nr:heavy-metal-associated domain-containing protein [Bacteroidales bacterium]
MKTIKIIMLAIAVCISISGMAQDNNKKDDKIAVVVLSSNIKCNNCKNKIEKNIPYEKGVKDLDVNIEKKTVTIKYRKDKNTADKLCEAVTKLGYKSIIIEEK